MERVTTIVLGGSGYVAGELLRLITAHPFLELAAAVSDSKPGEAIGSAFPHLASVYPNTVFHSIDTALQLITRHSVTAVLSAAPHGVSAELIDRLLTAATVAGTHPHVVDISADYRFRTAAGYQSVYHHAHGAPHRLHEFTCALPEHLGTATTRHVSHPGCFATAMLLAVVPLLKLDLVTPSFYISGITGSTGSGRSPTEGTHHPRRHSDLYSYNALAHRHQPEVIAIAKSITGIECELNFVPHSGPFARGIHATTQARLKPGVTAPDVSTALTSFYSSAPFVRLRDSAPRLKDVVSSNFAEISVSANESTVAVMSVIDNLTKGAAGGAIQWMNRLLNFDETTGLNSPAPGWT